MKKLNNYFIRHVFYIIYYQDILGFFSKLYFFAITYYNCFIKEELLLILGIVTLFSLARITKLKLENMTMQNINHNLLVKYKNVSNELDSYRMFKHNIYANLLSLKYQHKNIPLVIDTLLNKYTGKKNLKLGNLSMIEDFIYNHIYKYESLNSKINIALEDKILQSIDSMKYLNFFETLSILINNACEAAVDTNEKLFYLEVYLEDNYLIVSIINTFSNSIDVEDFGNLNYSTKKRNSGLGIYGALKNNKDINFKILDDLFVSEYRINI